jgi:threonine dehydrogenase-like Zn-dependent dehydrogenase
MSAICGTDIHAYRGHFNGLSPGTILGHEFVGDVTTIGDKVRHIHVGDHVFAADLAACGLCRCCRAGDHWHCGDRAFFGTDTAFGPSLPGAQSQQVRVPFADTTLCRVPDNCPDEAAIMVGDNLATGWVAVERGGVRPGDAVAVIGGGAIGQLTSPCAQTVGAGIVMVVEPCEERRRFAERHGALAAPPETANRILAAATSGRGADVIIEAVGVAPALDTALSLVRARSKLLSVGAHVAPQWALPLDRFFTDEVSLEFAIGDSLRVRDTLLSLIVSGVIDPSIMADERVSIENAPAAYREMAEQRTMKVLVEL